MAIYERTGGYMPFFGVDDTPCPIWVNKKPKKISSERWNENGHRILLRNLSHPTFLVLLHVLIPLCTRMTIIARIPELVHPSVLQKSGLREHVRASLATNPTSSRVSLRERVLHLFASCLYQLVFPTWLVKHLYLLEFSMLYAINRNLN
jgi:hypothetical protein